MITIPVCTLLILSSTPQTLTGSPHLKESRYPVLFDMSPIKPKENKAVLSVQRSTSALEPNGITYGILCHLPSTHHILATLYSQILFKSPFPQ